MAVSHKIGIIGAMDCEIAKLKELMKNIKSENTGRLNIFTGGIENHNIILVKCGVGKVNAALCCQYIIDKYNPDYIINTGIAGGLADNLSIGDIIIGQDLVQHDFDATDLGYAKGYMCTGVDKDKPTMYHSDKILIKKFEKAMTEFHSEVKFHRGIIATGDMFIGNTEKKKDIRKTYNALGAEMEGGAIAQTSNLNNVPCIIIRAISDLADGTVADSIDKTAADCASNTVTALLKCI